MNLVIRARTLNNESLSQTITGQFDERGGTIGRSDTNTITLPDPERHVSRLQAEIAFADGGFTVRNVGTANPIVVNGQQVNPGESAPLHGSDEMVIGAYSLHVELQSDEATRRPRPGSRAAVDSRDVITDSAGEAKTDPSRMRTSGGALRTGGAPPIPRPMPPPRPAPPGLPDRQVPPRVDPVMEPFAGPPPGPAGDPFADLLGVASSPPGQTPTADDPFADLLGPAGGFGGAPAARPVPPPPPPPPPLSRAAPDAMAPLSPPAAIAASPPVFPAVAAPPAARMPPAASATDDPFASLGRGVDLGSDPFADLLSPPPVPQRGAPAAVPAPTAGGVPPRPPAAPPADPFAGTPFASLPPPPDDYDPFEDLTGARARASTRSAQQALDDFFRTSMPNMPSAPPAAPGSSAASSGAHLSATSAEPPAPRAPPSDSGIGELLGSAAAGPGAPGGRSLDSLFDLGGDSDRALGDFLSQPPAERGGAAAAAPENVDPMAMFGIDPSLDDAPTGPAVFNHTPELSSAYAPPSVRGELPPSPLLHVDVPVTASPGLPPEAPIAAPERPRERPTDPPAEPLRQRAPPLPHQPQRPAVPPAAQAVTAADTASADAAVQALWDAFCRGAGVSLNPPQGLTPELMQTLGALLHHAVEGTLKLVAMRAAAKQELRSQVTVIQSRHNNPLKFSADPAAALAQLLMPPMRGFMPGPDAMHDAMDDLLGHGIGTMAGTRAAMQGMLKRFEPSQLEAKLTTHGVIDSLLPMSRRAKLWDLYLLHFQRIHDDAQDDFHELFGKAFVKAYEEQLDRLAASRHAAP